MHVQQQRHCTPTPELDCEGDECEEIEVKEEPLSEPESPASSCPPSPIHCVTYKYEQHRLKVSWTCLESFFS